MIEIYFDNTDIIELTVEEWDRMLWDDLCPVCKTESLRQRYVTENGDGIGWQCKQCNKPMSWVG